MPTAPTKPGRTCPNCNAFVPAGRRSCISCRLEVAKMDGFLAAKNAAKRRGFSGTQVENNGPPFFLRGGFIAKVLFLLAIAAIVGYFFLPKPPRYMAFPGSPTATAQQFLQDISGGDDKGFNQAYALVPDSVRNPKSSDEHGDYVQIYDEMDKYFSDEFGPDWLTQTKLDADPNDPDIIVAHVALETIHIHTADQVPPDKKSQQGSHFGVTGIDEFSIAWAGDFQQMEGIMGSLHMLTGSDSAGRMLQGVLGAANNRHAPPMVKKIGILQVLRDPHYINYKDVVQAYPFRTDPVMQNRLELVTKDDRYDQQVRDVAQQVLDDKGPILDELKTEAGFN